MKNYKLGFGFFLCMVIANMVSATNMSPEFTLTEDVHFPTNMLQGKTYSLPVIFTNTGEMPLFMTGMNLVNAPTGLNLPQANSCLNTLLSPGQTCTFSASYTPSAIGTAAFQVQIVANGYVWKRTNKPIYLTVNSDSDTASISSKATSIILTPDETATWTIHNDSTTVTAQNVTATIPAALAKYVATPSVCATIAPESDCEISLTVNGDLPVGQTGTLNAQGDNTDAVNVSYSSTQPNAALTVSSVTFSEPGSQNLVLTNTGLKTIAVTNLALDQSLYSVTLDSLPSNCADLAPNASCDIPLTSFVYSYGSGNVVASYHLVGDNTTKLATGSVSVGNPTVSINNGNDIIVSDRAVSGEFSVKNTGKFIWVAPSINSSQSWATIFPITSDECSDNIAPGVTCNYDYSINYPTTGSAQITATGANLISTSQNLLTNLLSISVGDTADQHLEYAAIKITNLSDVSQVLKTVQAPKSIDIGNTNSAVLCSSNGTDCNVDYHTTCVNGMALNTNQSCKLWYRAVSGAEVNPADTAESAISATVAENGNNPEKTYTQNINFTSDTALYVGGSFTQVGQEGGAGINVNGIAKWDGLTWIPLDTSDDFVTGYAFSLFKGDLYFGGMFAVLNGTSVSNIAAWNGVNWNNVGGGVSIPASSNFPAVFSMASTNDTLYVGGKFENATNDGKPIVVNNIAAWNGTSWSALGSGLAFPTAPVFAKVNAIAISGNDIYVGGEFTEAGSVAVGNLAEWDGAHWNATITVDGIVSSLLYANNRLYVGGQFNSLNHSSIAAHNIAEYYGQVWGPIGNYGVNNQGDMAKVNTLALNSDGGLLIGGEFSKADSLDVSNFVEWVNNAWSYPFSSDIVINGAVDAVTVQGSHIYVGGDFINPGNQLADFMNNQFVANPAFATNGQVKALLVAPSLMLTIAN